MNCRNCNLERHETEFYKGQGRTCKFCINQRGREYRLNNKADLLEKQKIYYLDVLIERRNKKRLEALPIKEEQRRKRLAAAEERKKEMLQSEKFKLNRKAYYQKHKKKFTSRQRQYLEENINAKIASRLRTRTYLAVKKHGIGKSDSMTGLLGCSIQEFITHLESLFEPGMTWQNHSRCGWHIDHIIPCSSFDLSDDMEQHKCFHFTNLQPLWAVENIRKSDKIAA